MSPSLHPLRALVTAGLLAAAAETNAQILTFDTLDASAGALSGAPVDNYFDSFGITVISANPLLVVDKNTMYSGNIVVPASSPNVLMLGGPNGTKSFSLEFDVPVASVSFNRAGIANTVASLAEWSATAYDSLSAPLSTVGEGALATGDSATPLFTLDGPAIKRITWTSTTGSAAFTSVLIDSISVVPEPETYALATGVGLVGLALGRRAAARARPRA